MPYSNEKYCENNAQLVNKSEHLLVAERMADELLCHEVSKRIEMIKLIVSIVRNAIIQECNEAVEKQKYLQDCFNSLKIT